MTNEMPVHWVEFRRSRPKSRGRYCLPLPRIPRFREKFLKIRRRIADAGGEWHAVAAPFSAKRGVSPVAEMAYGHKLTFLESQAAETERASIAPLRPES